MYNRIISAIESDWPSSKYRWNIMLILDYLSLILGYESFGICHQTLLQYDYDNLGQTEREKERYRFWLGGTNLFLQTLRVPKVNPWNGKTSIEMANNHRFSSYWTRFAEPLQHTISNALKCFGENARAIESTSIRLSCRAYLLPHSKQWNWWVKIQKMYEYLLFIKIWTPALSGIHFGCVYFGHTVSQMTFSHTNTAHRTLSLHWMCEYFIFCERSNATTAQHHIEGRYGTSLVP